MVQHCTETFLYHPSVLALPLDERKQLVTAQIKTEKDGFAPGALTSKAPISLAEEAAVLFVFFVLMGGPLILLGIGVYCFCCCSRYDCYAWLIQTLFLMFHPLPECREPLRRSWFCAALYKYFSYRFIWSDDDAEATELSPAWFGAGPPHGVLPLANLLSIPAINTFGFRRFVGAPASVVFHTPFLRYMTLLGCVEVGAKSITKAVGIGTCVGIVPDGIAGIFKCKEEDEVVYLKNRKGLAKLSLRTGTPLLPAYSIGNTAVFGAWFDPCGIMESLSRKAQSSIFIYWGRFGLPLPRRVNITMLFGRPIAVERVDEPTQAQVDELHERYLAAIKQLFDAHKAAVGWGHKTIRFV